MGITLHLLVLEFSIGVRDEANLPDAAVEGDFFSALFASLVLDTEASPRIPDRSQCALKKRKFRAFLEALRGVVFDNLFAAGDVFELCPVVLMGRGEGSLASGSGGEDVDGCFFEGGVPWLFLAVLRSEVFSVAANVQGCELDSGWGGGSITTSTALIIVIIISILIASIKLCEATLQKVVILYHVFCVFGASFGWDLPTGHVVVEASFGSILCRMGVDEDAPQFVFFGAESGHMYL